MTLSTIMLLIPHTFSSDSSFFYGIIIALACNTSYNAYFSDCFLTPTLHHPLPHIGLYFIIFLHSLALLAPKTLGTHSTNFSAFFLLSLWCLIPDVLFPPFSPNPINFKNTYSIGESLYLTFSYTSLLFFLSNSHKIEELFFPSLYFPC